MERKKHPNKGLMSPPGGKLKQDEPESPSMCAVREFSEECSIESNECDWKLKGIVTEKNYPTVGNIMIFLMEYNLPVDELPADCNEGSFHFIHPDKFNNYKIPVSDKQFLWKNVIGSNGEVFILGLDCSDYPVIKQLKY